MRRSTLAIATLATVCAALSAANAAPAGSGCRPPYIVPYAEQCDFEHNSIRKDRSRANVAAAYAACDRAQTEAGNCLSSKVKQLHVISLSALYRSVAEQADIAMFAGQYKTAEALLREDLGVLDVAAREARPGDPSVAAERTAVDTALEDSLSGECTERAYLAGLPARAFAHDHRYKDLEKALAGQYVAYSGCARLATTTRKRVYTEYVALVALEESGRAAQADGNQKDATKLFGACLKGAARSSALAAGDTKHYLAILTTLCAGRMNGKYRVDQPRPLDREGEGFRPLALPAQQPGSPPQAQSTRGAGAQPSAGALPR
jgi:hypothetical protein